MGKLENAWLNEATGEVMTPKGRLAWPKMLEAVVNRKFPNNPPKFSATILLPKAANIDAIKTEIARAVRDKYGAGKKCPPDKLPLKKTAENDAIAEYAEDYPYYLVTSANADYKPAIFGPDTKPFSGSPSEIYGGRWAVIAGKAWGYPKGYDGVGWNLDRVQLLDHDDPVASGRIQTAEGFERFEGDVGGTAVDVGTGKAKSAPKTSDGVFDDELGI